MGETEESLQMSQNYAAYCRRGHFREMTGSADYWSGLDVIPTADTFAVKKFCSECGSEVIGFCSHCQGAIEVNADYCSQCGKPLPWTEEALQIARETAESESSLTEEDRRKFAQAFQNLLTSNPRTVQAAYWIKSKLEKFAAPANEIILGLVKEVAVEVAKGLLLGK
jgi:hypothetical protein